MSKEGFPQNFDDHQSRGFERRREYTEGVGGAVCQRGRLRLQLLCDTGSFRGGGGGGHDVWWGLVWSWVFFQKGLLLSVTVSCPSKPVLCSDCVQTMSVRVQKSVSFKVS